MGDESRHRLRSAGARAARRPRDGPASGLTAAAVVVPKALAYATIAGLPVQAGLFAAIVPMVVYAALGTSRVLSTSTTTPIAILCATAIGEALRADPSLDPLAAAATLSMLVGLMLVAARVMRLGFLANFISDPVLTGFKAGVGFVIVVDQVPKLLGIHIHKEGFFRDVGAIVTHLPDLSWPTVTVAAATLGVIALAQRLLPKSPAPLIAVAAGIAAAAILGLEGFGVSLVGPDPRRPSGAAGSASVALRGVVALGRGHRAHRLHRVDRRGARVRGALRSAHRRESRAARDRRGEHGRRLHRLDARGRRNVPDRRDTQCRREDAGRLAGGGRGGLRHDPVPRAGPRAAAARDARRRRHRVFDRAREPR
jgi:hypothetical protein